MGADASLTSLTIAKWGFSTGAILQVKTSPDFANSQAFDNRQL